MGQLTTWLLGVSSLTSVLAGPTTDAKAERGAYAYSHAYGEEAARVNAPAIFNAVHDAMRQWGSSLHHNGMSYFLATVPEGVLLHHGSSQELTPTEPDWLAFEIEHAENFARRGFRPPDSRRPGENPPHDSPLRDDPSTDSQDRPLWESQGKDAQKILSSHSPASRSSGDNDDDDDKDNKDAHGWLHVYRAQRPLHYIYIDGMGGGKTSMGTLDSQDIVLRRERPEAAPGPGPGQGPQGFSESAERTDGRRPPSSTDDDDGIHARAGGPMNERQRASDLCALVQPWGMQGVIRMEAGFEIIQCDFSDGLEPLQKLRRSLPLANDTDGRDHGGFIGIGRPFESVEYIRALTERYQGIGSHRTILDFSSMVSAFFVPGLNLTNPDATRPDLPRLVSADEAGLETIRQRLTAAAAHAPWKESGQETRANIRTIDWQDVTDLIVGRYADRLQLMAEEASLDTIRRELNLLLDVYIDYPQRGHFAGVDVPAAIRRCTRFYLHAFEPTTDTDRLVHTALSTVMQSICSTLFHVRAQTVTDHAATASDSGWQEEEVEEHGDDGEDGEDALLESSRSALRTLMGRLNWARFKRCPACGLSRVCTIPMWPMGTEAQYKSPQCSNGTMMPGDKSYWGSIRPPPRED